MYIKWKELPKELVDNIILRLPIEKVMLLGNKYYIKKKFKRVNLEVILKYLNNTKYVIILHLCFPEIFKENISTIIVETIYLGNINTILYLRQYFDYLSFKKYYYIINTETNLKIIKWLYKNNKLNFIDIYKIFDIKTIFTILLL